MRQQARQQKCFERSPTRQMLIEPRGISGIQLLGLACPFQALRAPAQGPDDDAEGRGGALTPSQS